MPELPEVETTRRGIAPWLSGRPVRDFRIHNAAMRWPVEIPETVRGATVRAVERRAKYLLLRFDAGTLIVHLGMSGSLRLVTPDVPRLKHDHVEFVLDGGRVLRLNDPRRFGCVLWQPDSERVHDHWLLARLGVEPLSDAFSGAYLKTLARGRRVAVKNFIMDAQIVVGVGNIYAAESLFLAGIRPTVQARRVSLAGYERLASEIRTVLSRSIEVGGTTLRDFVNQDGKPGYFRQSLNVYGRAGEPCRVCATPIKQIVLGQRASAYCPKCQRSQGFRPA